MQSCVLHLPGAERSPPTAPSCSTRMGPPAPSGSSCLPSPAPGQPGTAHLLIKTSRSGSELNSCQQMQPACKARHLQSTQNMNAAITRAAVRQQCEVLFWCVLKQAENFSRAFSPFAEGQASRVLTSPTRSRGRRPGQKQAQGLRGTAWQEPHRGTALPSLLTLGSAASKELQIPHLTARTVALPLLTGQQSPSWGCRQPRGSQASLKPTWSFCRVVIKGS